MFLFCSETLLADGVGHRKELAVNAKIDPVVAKSCCNIYCQFNDYNNIPLYYSTTKLPPTVSLLFYPHLLPTQHLSFSCLYVYMYIPPTLSTPHKPFSKFFFFTFLNLLVGVRRVSSATSSSSSSTPRWSVPPTSTRRTPAVVTTSFSRGVGGQAKSILTVLPDNLVSSYSIDLSINDVIECLTFSWNVKVSCGGEM